MRGERLEVQVLCCPVGGSSPHARGTQRPRNCPGPSRRFIPACAGNAVSVFGDHTRNSVHPRMRGERDRLKSLSQGGDGSSPHARGTPQRMRTPRFHKRFIPACAGNARHALDVRNSQPVHPRMRGERVAPSSPQAPISVHPRMRGERLSASSWGSCHGGSSPHARGTRHEVDMDGVRVRFIPACAGNASTAWRSRAGRAVHPRMRGERDPVSGLMHHDDGSSPHARGTPVAGSVSKG